MTDKPKQPESDVARVAEFFADAQKALELRFRGFEKDLPHQGEKGGIRERRIVDFLSSVLPKRYGVGTGHIIGSDKPFISSQTDIVIYDALNGITLPLDSYYSLFPCECVYAAVEVKSKLDARDGKGGPGGEIYRCMRNTTRLKKFDRSNRNLPTITSIVFAYETTWKQNQPAVVSHWFERFGEKYSMKLPEMVFVLDPGFVLTKAPKPNQNAYSDENEFADAYDRHPLLFFVSELTYRLAGIELMTPPNLWNEYTVWQRGDVILRRNETEILQPGVDVVEYAPTQSQAMLRVMEVVHQEEKDK
jgi:hypothetical protein